VKGFTLYQTVRGCRGAKSERQEEINSNREKQQITAEDHPPKIMHGEGKIPHGGRRMKNMIIPER